MFKLGYVHKVTLISNDLCIGDHVMTTQLPVKMIAQLEDIAVFQTAAFVEGNIEQEDQRLQDDYLSADYGALNLGLHVADNPSVVLDNRMRLLSAINQQLDQSPYSSHPTLIKSLHWVNQVHGNDVQETDVLSLHMQPMSADAMISQQDAVGLAIMTADCVPIVLYQPASGKIAAIHAGWQGLANGIIKVTAERFTVEGQIMAWMGVCISHSQYEVGTQVVEKLHLGCVNNELLTTSKLKDFERLYVAPSHADVNSDVSCKDLHNVVDKLSNIAKVSSSKIKLNLPKLAADQLSTVGISLCNDQAIACSYTDHRFYSYRRQTHLRQSATGRMALVIVRHCSIRNTVD